VEDEMNRFVSLAIAAGLLGGCDPVLCPKGTARQIDGSCRELVDGGAADASISPIDAAEQSDAALDGSSKVDDAAPDGSALDDGSTPTSDAGADSAAPDGGPPQPAIEAFMGTTSVTADWSCVGTPRPSATADAYITPRFVELAGASMSRFVPLPEGTTVDFFKNDVVTDTCASPGCVTGTVQPNTTGSVPVTIPGDAWYAYRVNANATGMVVATVGYARSPASPLQPFVGTSTPGLVGALLGHPSRTPGTALFYGSVMDCAGSSLKNVEIHVFRGATELAAPMWIGYLNGLAANTEPRTGDGGSFAGAEVPAGENIRFEARGRLTATGDAVVIACQEAVAAADTALALGMGPLQSGFPAGSACASLPTNWAP
jgi:hypothetical protein